MRRSPIFDGRRDRFQRAVILQMRLQQAEPIKGEFSGLFP